MDVRFSLQTTWKEHTRPWFCACFSDKEDIPKQSRKVLVMQKVNVDFMQNWWKYYLLSKILAKIQKNKGDKRR